MKNIAIFASGSGSNAEAIIQYFANKSDAGVSLIISNKPTAYVLERAKFHDIPSIVINRESFYNDREIINVLNEYDIDLLVLAGFLWLVPEYLIDIYPDKIMNIHPALLPKYGGKGMYGKNVHKAVKENREEMSGITIHYVNKQYDEGKHLFQASVRLSENDSADDIAAKVLKLEHKYYPRVIDYILTGLN